MQLLTGLIFALFSFIYSSNVFPDSPVREAAVKTSKKELEASIAEVVETRRCLFGCNRMMRVWPSNGQISNTIESEPSSFDESLYHIFTTPRHSASSFQTFGMSAIGEGNIWESPESPFKRITDSKDDDYDELRREENRIAKVIQSHPLLKAIELQMEKLELISREPVKKGPIQSVFEMSKLLKLICSFLTDDFKAFRSVNHNFRDAQEQCALESLKCTSQKLTGMEINLCLTQILPKQQNLAAFLKDGLMASKENAVIRAKFLILTEIALKLNFVTFKFFDNLLTMRIFFREVCMLGLRTIFELIRKFDNKFYLESIRGDNNINDANVQSVLILLIEFYRVDIFKIVLDDLQRKDVNILKLTLMASVQYNRPEMIKLILEKIPPAEVTTISHEIDRNPLMLAIELGHLECLRVFFTLNISGKEGKVVDFFQRTSRGMTITHFAIHSGNEEIIRFLWEKGVFLANPIDNNDRTAIHYAAAFAPTSILRLILGLQKEETVGYPLMTCDIQGSLPLHYAISSGNHENAKLLLKWIDHSIYYPFLEHFPMREEEVFDEKAILAMPSPFSVDRAKLIPHTPSPTTPDAYKRLKFFRELSTLRTQPEKILPQSDGAADTPLHIAVKYNRLEMVKMLLESLPQLNERRDSMGRTAFLLAIIQGHSSIVSYFLHRLTLRKGFNFHERTILQLTDFRGNNGLHLAIKYDYEEIFDMLLLSHLYSIHDSDSKGFTALQLAEFYGRASVLRKIKAVLPKIKHRKSKLTSLNK